jgi:membrane-associated protease RseP (regulator of RpoE activity)
MLPPEPRPTRWELHGSLFGGVSMFGVWIASVLISLLAHEAGHILAARLFGVRVRSVLSGLGGQVYGLDELNRWQRVLVLLAGSLANLLILGVLWAFTDPQWNPLPNDRLTPEWRSFLGNSTWALMMINALWALLNVVPLWPLDGGRIAVEIGEAVLGRRGQTLALLLSLLVCLLMSLTVAAWARLTLVSRFDLHYVVDLLFFSIQFLYCYLFWLSAFRALWGDAAPLDETGKSGRAA